MAVYTEAGVLRRVVRQASTSRPLAWLSARVLHRIDRFVHRATRGRSTFSGWASGLPVVLLTTTGARTGLRRTTPVLGILDGDRLIVIASNFGSQQHPAWYHNLRAHPGVSVTVDGVSREYEAHQLAGEDRERQFRVAVQLNPGWLRYRSWAGERQIPVIRLDPINSSEQGNQILAVHGDEGRSYHESEPGRDRDGTQTRKSLPGDPSQ